MFEESSLSEMVSIQSGNPQNDNARVTRSGMLLRPRNLIGQNSNIVQIGRSNRIPRNSQRTPANCNRRQLNRTSGGIGRSSARSVSSPTMERQMAYHRPLARTTARTIHESDIIEIAEINVSIPRTDNPARHAPEIEQRESNADDRAMPDNNSLDDLSDNQELPDDDVFIISPDNGELHGYAIEYHEMSPDVIVISDDEDNASGDASAPDTVEMDVLPQPTYVLPNWIRDQLTREMTQHLSSDSVDYWTTQIWNNLETPLNDMLNQAYLNPSSQNDGETDSFYWIDNSQRNTQVNAFLNELDTLQPVQGAAAVRCIICTLPTEDPIGCAGCENDVGCRSCITKWVTSPNESALSCPLCRFEWNGTNPVYKK